MANANIQFKIDSTMHTFIERLQINYYIKEPLISIPQTKIFPKQLLTYLILNRKSR